MSLKTIAAMAFGVLVALVLYGDFWSVHRMTVLEIICEPRTPLNAENRCTKIGASGDTINIVVNTTTQQVLLDVLPSNVMRDWPQGTSLLENCRVVDDSNWECTRTDHLLDGAWSIRTGVMKGQFYIAQAGQGGLTVNSSGLSGWRYWAVYIRALAWQQAVKL